VSGKSAIEKGKAAVPTQADPAAIAIDYLAESSKLPLDVAVFESICQSGAEDKVKRVATNILVVGGVGNLQGIGWALQSR
jgi:actin-related protein 8